MDCRTNTDDTRKRKANSISDCTSPAPTTRGTTLLTPSPFAAAVAAGHTDTDNDCTMLPPATPSSPSKKFKLSQAHRPMNVCVDACKATKEQEAKFTLNS